MKKNTLSYALAIVGMAVIGTGLYWIKTVDDPQGIMRALPYIFVGLGCGIFGHGTGDLISRRAMKSSPELARKLEIEKNDERNVAISNRAKAKAFDIMFPVFGALMVAFALMGVDLAVTLLMVFAYLFVAGCGIYYRCKYDKEM
ncbi:MAG: DUF6442 family protein [Lawsonibacter sp.]